MGKKLSREEFIKRVNEIFNSTLDLTDFDFVNTMTKGLCRCKVCGHEWEVKGNTLLNGHGCRKCYDKRNSNKRKITQEEIQDKIYQTGNNIKIIGEYIDTKHKCLVKCEKCGYEWETKSSELIRGHGCPECNGNIVSNKRFNEKLLSLYGDMYECEDNGYTILNNPIKLKCNKHGIFEVKYARKIWEMNKTKILCPFCIKENKEEIECRKEELQKKKEEKKQEKLRKKLERENNKRKPGIMPNEEFIKKAKEKYGENTYSYDKTCLKNWKEKVTITCPKHGDFQKNPSSFLNGHGCRMCSRSGVPYSNKEWVFLATEKHPEFNYDKVEYVNKATPIIVGCPKHGDIRVYPNTFLRVDNPCPQCRKDVATKQRSDEYWNRIKEIYKNKDYEILNENEIINNSSKLTVKCNKHNYVFTPTVSNIMGSGCGCTLCGIERNAENNRLKIDDIKERINKIHNNKYDLSLFTEYKNIESKTPIICPIHGKIHMTVHSLLSGQECQKCGSIKGGKKIRLSHEEFIDRVSKVHLGKDFDFSKTKYIKGTDKVVVICNKKDKFGNKHGDFEIKAGSLLMGNGCPKCNMSHLEQEINAVLIKNDIKFEKQYRFKWLGKQSLDFYLPDYNIAIECQGEQHFRANFFKSKGVDYAEKMLNGVKERDKRKKMLCQKNNVKLVYYLREYFVPYLSEDDLYFTNKEDLVKFLNKN